MITWILVKLFPPVPLKRWFHHLKNISESTFHISGSRAESKQVFSTHYIIQILNSSLISTSEHIHIGCNRCHFKLNTVVSNFEAVLSSSATFFTTNCNPEQIMAKLHLDKTYLAPITCIRNAKDILHILDSAVESKITTIEESSYIMLWLVWLLRTRVKIALGHILSGNHWEGNAKSRELSSKKPLFLSYPTTQIVTINMIIHRNRGFVKVLF